MDEQLGMALEAIREIEMDHRAGNLSDEDFSALDAAERARAVELMRRADELRQAGQIPDTRRSPNGQGSRPNAGGLTIVRRAA